MSRLDISDVDFERMECVVLGKGNKERKVYLTEVAAMHRNTLTAGKTPVRPFSWEGENA